ncbi:MAG: hypothetical protein LUQ59_07815 [Methanothrix sp.]|nr:hypothetical protein [Methanothrix sp.]
MITTQPQSIVRIAPQGTEIVRISFVSHTGRENTIFVELLPGAGYRMPFATMINLWDIHGHMMGKAYPTIETFLDDSAPGWKTWRECSPLPAPTNSEETAIIKAALCRADIHPKRVRHYRGPLIITMDRPERYEGEFLQIEILAWEALDAAPNARNCCTGIHVFSQFHGKLAASYEIFRRCK